MKRNLSKDPFAIAILLGCSIINCLSLKAQLTLPRMQHIVAFYPFCGNANDATGNGNNVSVNTATLTSDRFGYAGQAYHFNGSQYMQGNCSNFPTGSRTISLWFKIGNTSKHNTLFGYGGDPACGKSFYGTLNSTPWPNAYVVHSHCNGTPACVTDPNFPQDTTWKNWIITTNNDTTTFYVNGIKIHTCSSGSNFNGTVVATKAFIFGACVDYTGCCPYSDVNVDYLTGYLDDIVIYDTVLNQSEVSSLYTTFSTNPFPHTGCWLPVTWLYFKANAHLQDAELSWATAQEQNSKEFIVERSLNGRDYISLASVRAAGNTNNETSYHYLDKNIPNNDKIIFYRIKQVDLDRKFVYSSVVKLSMNREHVIKTSPNPFKQSMILEFPYEMSIKEGDNVQLFTIEGKRVYRYSFSNADNSIIELKDLPKLTSGVYILKASLNKQVFTLKVVHK